MAELDLPDRHVQQLQRLLRVYVPDFEVWAYGSRVTGTSHEGSDLDLVLRHPQALGAPCAALFDLQEAIQNSSLPILVDIHDWAALPASFHAEISATHVLIQTPA